MLILMKNILTLKLQMKMDYQKLGEMYKTGQNIMA